MTNVGDRPLAFLDTETTGLEPGIHEVIEIAVIRVEKDGSQSRMEIKIAPERIETASPRALEINGYTPERWLGAPPMGECAREIAKMLKDCVIVGHNPKFDLGMLEGAFRNAGVEARLPYHAVDTVTMAYVELVPLGLRFLSLDKIREFLGWSKDNAHTAMKDAEDAMNLFYLLDRPNWWRRFKLKRMIRSASKN